MQPSPGSNFVHARELPLDNCYGGFDMGRIRVHNFSATGIIYQANSPEWVFMEVKTPGYPQLAYVGKGLLIGGNWVRPNAKDDGGPLGTFQREVAEELSFGNPAVDPQEMEDIFGKGHMGHAPAIRDIAPSDEDKKSLAHVVSEIRNRAMAWRAFIETVDRAVFDRANPNNKLDGYQGLCHVFLVPLPAQEWSMLEELQNRYGNLSNESQSLIISAKEIVKKKLMIAWGQDQILRRFFLARGVTEAADMLLMPDTKVQEVPSVYSYNYLAQEYDVEKVPEGIVWPSAS